MFLSNLSEAYSTIVNSSVNLVHLQFTETEALEYRW